MNGLRAVVVGTSFGCRVHVPALRAAGFEVVALVGRDLERTQRRADRLDVAHAATSLAQLTSVAGAVDVVTVATPPDTHAALTVEALALGAHVLCEKPFALDASQARRMCDAASAAGRVGLVGHEFRFSPARALVARLLADGAVGTPQLATLVQYIDLVADPAARVPEWWFDTERGGGWLGASGSHVIDQVHHWLGDVDVDAVRAAALVGR